MAYIESVIIRDTGGTEADVTAANALKVDGSAVTQPVDLVGGLEVDAFKHQIVESRYNQIEIKYDSTDPDSITGLTVTKTTTGDASNVAGQALFTTGSNTNGGVTAITTTTVTYRPHAEIYAAFSVIWPSGGLANSYQRLGLYDTNNGFFIGYEGTVFGITVRKAAVDTQTAQASFNVDTLTGAANSKFTRAGVPEAANFAFDNLFRIRYGWLGAAPIFWEIFSPDGDWVLFHIIRYPNSAAVPSINNPSLPMHLELKKNTGGATVLDMNTGCWGAGTTSDLTKITDTITDDTLAVLNRSVITGRSSSGGGTYHNVKVTPSGALVTAGSEVYAEDTAHTSGNDGAFVLGVRNDANAVVTSANGDYSQISVNDKGAIAIQDGGNSITVDGTITSTVDFSYAEDTVSSPGDKGAFILGVRNDDQSSILTSANSDYSGISVDDRGRVATVGAQSVNLPHIGGAQTMGSVDNASGNVLVTNIYDLANNDALVVGLADTNGNFYPTDTIVTSIVNQILATQYNEDRPHTTNDTGNFVLAVRNDTNAVVTDTDGDYSQISVNDKGAVAIQDGGNSITVDGTVAVSSVSGNVTTLDAQKEDTLHTNGDYGSFILGVRNDTNAVVTNTDGDYSQISVNDKGAIAIQDGGNSITVDGTVAATQSGTWTLGANSGVDIGDVTINNASGASAVNIQDGGNSITVDGTVAATQSGTWNINDISGTISLPTGAATSANQSTMVTALQLLDDVVATDGSAAGTKLYQVGGTDGTNAQILSTNTSGHVNIADGGNSITVDGTVTVTPPTLTKGTQGATGFSTQDLKDAGRTAVRYYATAAAAGTTTTETAITLTKSSGTSATSTGTSFTPTSGKTFRIQAVSFATRGNATATAQTTTFNFRINTAGAVTTTSTPIILAMRSATPATANAWDRVLLEIPDGLEIAGDGTLQFGITAAATYTTNAPTWDVTIIGFEY